MLLLADPILSAQEASSEETNFANFQNAPVDLVLDTYEVLSGKHLIREKGVGALPPITINSSGLSKQDTLKLIESNLMLNGMVIVPVDDQTSKIVLANTTRNPRSEGIKLYANVSDFPPGEEVISYYMPLTYISPHEAQEIFQQHSPPHSYGSYVPAPSAQAIILTEDTNTIRQLIALHDVVDIPPAQLTNQFVTLNYSDAIKVADTLNSILGLNASSHDLPGAAPTSELSVEASVLVGPTRIEADARSNRILILTRDINLPLINQLISRLDEPGDSMQPQRRQLKYVQALDILPALESALAQGKDEVISAKSDQDALNNRNRANASSGNNDSSSGAGPNALPPANTSGSSNGTAITPPLHAPAENNVPQVVTVGRTRLMADNRSNCIIVFGAPDAVNRVFSMIDELDQQPLQVYLSTIIGQLTVTKDFEFGVDLLQKYSNTGKSGIASSSLTGTGTTSSAAIPNPTLLTGNAAFPIASGLTLYGVIGNQINSYIRALESTNRFQVISHPSVFTSNNKLAVIASGSQIPVPVNTTSGVTGTDSTLVTNSSIQYQNVLLQLDIIPLINADHQVTLKIRQTNNSLGTAQVISGNSIPSIVTQEINTEVTLPDKSTVVIGGLISESKKKAVTGVPLLSSIPFIGNLFKDTSTDDERDELIIMIQPTVVENAVDRLAASEGEKRKSLMYIDLNKTENNIPTTNLAEKKKAIPPANQTKSAFPSPAPAPEDEPAPAPATATPSSTVPDPNQPVGPADIPDYMRPR